MFPITLAVLILVVVGITVVVVKAGAIALRLTGLDEQRAQFQALSAVTGTGFTTRESELVVSDATRRKIVSFLMVFGNVVLVLIMGLLVGSFTTFAATLAEIHKDWSRIPASILVIAIAALLLYIILRSRGLTRLWSRWIHEKMTARLRLRERPVHEVLALAEGYGVAEIRLEADSPCAGKTLATAGLRHLGLLVLAIRRAGLVIPNPSAVDVIQADDRLVCYGELVRMHEFIGQDVAGRAGMLGLHPGAAGGGMPAGTASPLADTPHAKVEKSNDQ
jgi:hypothetical protein